MDAKEYLNQIETYDIKIKRMNEEVARLESIVNNATSGINPDKAQTSPDKSRREKAITRMVDLKNQILDVVAEYEIKRSETIQMIYRLDDPRYIEILYLRYVKGIRVEDIADIMHKPNGSEYSVEHLIRLHGHALNAFRKIYHEAM